MNVIRYCLTVICLFVVLFCSAIDVIPHPTEYDINPYVSFDVDENTAIVVKNKELSGIANIFASTLRKGTGYSFDIKKQRYNSIVLRIDKTIKNKEGYYLNISPFSVYVYGGSKAGVFYGLQTLLQLFPSEIESDTVVNRRWSLPCAVIDDAPRFPYRALYYNPENRFVSIDSLKNHIKWMSKFKLNVLHLQLTQKSLSINDYNCDNHCCYSRDELRELVEFADDYCVTVIPEVVFSKKYSDSSSGFSGTDENDMNKELNDIFSVENSGFSRNEKIDIYRDGFTFFESDMNDSIFSSWHYSYLYSEKSDTSTNNKSIMNFPFLREMYDWKITCVPLSETGAVIQGVQTNFWYDMLSFTGGVEQNLYPRILAFSEKAWSIADNDWLYFKQRVDSACVRLKVDGVRSYDD